MFLDKSGTFLAQWEKTTPIPTAHDDEIEALLVEAALVVVHRVSFPCVAAGASQRHEAQPDKTGSQRSEGGKNRNSWTRLPRAILARAGMRRGWVHGHGHAHGAGHGRGRIMHARCPVRVMRLRCPACARQGLIQAPGECAVDIAPWRLNHTDGLKRLNLCAE